MAAVYSAVDTMANQITLFTTLQGMTLQLLILRLIKILSAQKRLSVLTKTTIKVCYSSSSHILSTLCWLGSVERLASTRQFVITSDS